MKPTLLRLLFICLLLVRSGILAAQTPSSVTLYKLDRTKLKAKIRKVTANDVYYTEPSQPNKPRTIRKTELWKIVYGSGRTTVLNTPKIQDASMVSTSPTNQTVIARADSAAVPSKSVLPAPVQQSVSAQQAVAPSTRPIAEQTGAHSIIKYAPLSNFGYEHVLKKNHSLYAGLSVYSLGFGTSAIGVKAEYRFYGLIKSSPKQAPEGFWVAPTVLLWRVSVSDFYDTESAYIAQIGSIAGYQWIFNRKISLEPALGLSLTAVGSGSDTSLGAGVVPLFAVRVGYVLK